MMSALKAEFRKLLTIRSTYVITFAALALVIFFSFYVIGYKADKSDLMNPLFLAGQATGSIGTIATIPAIVAILLMTHEYRYGTIMYSLTASSRRTKVLLAKIFTITMYALIFSAVVGALAPLMAYLGVHASGGHLIAQHLAYSTLAWQVLFFGTGMLLTGLLFGVLLRSQVAAIAAIFIVPGAIEQILSLLLKKDAVYLPFTLLRQVVGSTPVGGGHLSPSKAAGLFALYLVAGWIIAWVLFVRRDAN